MMVVESRAIVTGKVTGLSTSIDASTQLVYTYIRLEVNAVVKGDIKAREIVLKELGGETHDHGTMIFGMPRFTLGQEVLLFLNTWPDGALRVHQGFLGEFHISRDPSTGQRFAERQMIDQNINIMSPAGDGTNRRELNAYMAVIAHLMGANRKEMRDFERRFFSGVPMLAQPHEFRLRESSGEFFPQWALQNPGSPARWFEADSNQPIVFYVNPAGAPSCAKLQEDVQAAMDAWSNAGASIRVSYGAPTSGCGLQLADGVNTISFNNCDNYFAPSQSCSGLIAMSGIVRYLPSQTKTIGGITYGKAVESNIAFNPSAICNFTNRCQLQEVATHEMGHALGLGHTPDTTATMAAFIHFDNRCAALMLDDIQGIAAIYPGILGSSPLNIMTSGLPTARVDADYNASLLATGGSGGYHWRVVRGQLAPGFELGMSGLLFGRTSASGNFDITAQVSDSSGNTSEKPLTLVVRPPGLPPTITAVEYRKKKIFVFGQDLQENALVYVDALGLSTTFDGVRLTTTKKKLQPGVHQVYVANPDGKQSGLFQLVVE